MKIKKSFLKYNNPDIREILSGPKLEPVLPKQNRPNLDIRDLFSDPDNSLISGLNCTTNDLFLNS